MRQRRRRRSDVFSAASRLESAPATALRGLQALAWRVEGAVERAALLAAHVSGMGKLLWQALFRAGGMEDAGAPIFLDVHDAGVLELFDEGFLAPAGTVSRRLTINRREDALVVRVAHVQHLLGVVHIPGPCKNNRKQKLRRTYHFLPKQERAKCTKSLTSMKLTQA